MGDESVLQGVQQSAQQNEMICGTPADMRWPESRILPTNSTFHISCDTPMGRFRIQNRKGKLLVWGPGWRELPVADLPADDDEALARAKRYARREFVRRLKEMMVEDRP